MTTSPSYLVSAIVSTYNAEYFIAGCLADLEAQTIADQMEIIVVDSGSRQNERDIVNAFQKQYGNIVYIRTEIRETVYASWNRGIKAAHGKYITNANTDDRHRRDAFECMVNLLEKNPEIALAYADILVTETANETFHEHTRTGSWAWYDWNRNNLLDKGCFIGPQPMWRKSVHDIYGYFDESLITSGDYEFWLRISQTFDFIHIKEPLGLYLKSSDSIEHRSAGIKEQEDANILRQYRNAADEGTLIKYQPLDKMEESHKRTVSHAILCKTRWWPDREKLCSIISVIDSAWEFQRLGQIDDSIQLLFKEIAVNPGEILLYHTLAAIMAEAKLYHDALHILDSLPFHPEDNRRLELAEFCRNRLAYPRHSQDGNVKKLSLCMIVRDEESRLAKCIMSLRSIVDESIVIDTGSRDRTKDIAKDLGADVYELPWTDDFSAARNFSISKASGDWILILDADEVIAAQDITSLSKLVQESPLDTAYAFDTRNYINDFHTYGWTGNDGLYGLEEAGCGWFPSTKVRLFPRDSQIRFEHPVHELVDPSLRRAGINIVKCSIPVHHYGKLDKKSDTAKGEKYYRLGKSKLDENEPDIQFLSELAIQAGGLGKDDEALDLWQRVIRLKPGDTTALLNIGGLLIGQKRYREAFISLNIALTINPCSTAVLYNCSICEFFLGNHLGAIAHLDRLLEIKPEYLPAVVLQSSALCLSEEKEKGLRRLSKLLEKGINCSEYIFEVAERLKSIGRPDYAFSLLVLAIESRQTNDAIYRLKESLKKDDSTMLS